MVKFNDPTIKPFLTAYGIEDAVYRLSVVFEDIYENEPQWMTDNTYLSEAVTLYILRLYTKSLTWGCDGAEIFRFLTNIPDTVSIPSGIRDAWNRFLSLAGYSVPQTPEGDVDMHRIPTSMHDHIYGMYLGRACDALFENVRKAAKTFK